MTTNHGTHPDLAGDVRLAPVLDICHLLNHPAGPSSIRESLDTDRWYSYTTQTLVYLTGSLEALEMLDAEPHTQAKFEWRGIAPSAEARLSEVLNMFEQAGRWFDREYCVIMWRVLRHLALNPERPLDRRAKPARLAAAIAWVALGAGDKIGRGYGRLPARDVWQWFGVSSCIDLARDFADSIARSNLGEGVFFDAIGPTYGQTATLLADCNLLHSRFRKSLLQRRDQLETWIDDDRGRSEAHYPVCRGDEGKVGLRSRPTTVRWATKGTTEAGRAGISIALGSLDDIELLWISIPDAHRLLDALKGALDAPIPHA